MTSKKVDLALELFRTYKTGFIKKKKTEIVEERSKPGDPTLISDVLENLVTHRQWESGLAEGNLLCNGRTLSEVMWQHIQLPFQFTMAHSLFNVHPLHGQHNCKRCRINCWPPSRQVRPVPWWNPCVLQAPPRHHGRRASAPFEVRAARAIPTAKRRSKPSTH